MEKVETEQQRSLKYFQPRKSNVTRMVLMGFIGCLVGILVTAHSVWAIEVTFEECLSVYKGKLERKQKYDALQQKNSVLQSEAAKACQLTEECRRNIQTYSNLKMDYRTRSGLLDVEIGLFNLKFDRTVKCCESTKSVPTPPGFVNPCCQLVNEYASKMEKMRSEWASYMDFNKRYAEEEVRESQKLPQLEAQCNRFQIELSRLQTELSQQGPPPTEQELIADREFCKKKLASATDKGDTKTFDKMDQIEKALNVVPTTVIPQVIDQIFKPKPQKTYGPLPNAPPTRPSPIPQKPTQTQKTPPCPEGQQK